MLALSHGHLHGIGPKKSVAIYSPDGLFFSQMVIYPVEILFLIGIARDPEHGFHILPAHAAKPQKPEKRSLVRTGSEHTADVCRLPVPEGIKGLMGDQIIYDGAG